jgi:3-oxoacyl-[acyl-carrier-protein] synthase II
VTIWHSPILHTAAEIINKSTFGTDTRHTIRVKRDCPSAILEVLGSLCGRQTQQRCSPSYDRNRQSPGTNGSATTRQTGSLYLCQEIQLTHRLFTVSLMPLLSINNKCRVLALLRQRQSLKIYNRHFGISLPVTPLLRTNRRVVVTGLGTVNPLGNNVISSWDQVLNGASATNIVPEFVDANLPVHIGATAKREDNHGERKDKKQSANSRVETSSFIALASAAAAEALEDANWYPKTYEEQVRTGISLGAGIGPLEEIMEATRTLDAAHGVRRLSPYFIPRTLINLAAGSISLKFCLKGPNHSCVTACATGANSIGDASRFISFGDADVMLAGGTESCLNKMSVAGFSRLRALTSSFNNDPKFASRPFDRDRDGFVLGEGAGVLVLEEYEHACERGAKIYAEIRGYGLSADAHHITAPCKEGDGAYRAMESALKHAGLSPDHIDYVNAHATSTPLGDIAECRALRRLFQDNPNRRGGPVSISSTKGATGHLLGAAGAVEAIFSVLALYYGKLPPTVNLFNVDESAQDLNIIPDGEYVEKKCRAVLTNSFGFGGTNCSLVFADVH